MWPKFELKLLLLSLLPARKMKALEWPQHFSRYKSMGIFTDAQGQQTVVRGGMWPKSIS